MAQGRSVSRTRSIALAGLSVALLTVSAWITIPLGPVPITLQIFVMVLVLLALSPQEAFATLGCYLLMGAVGLPVFSSMRGGLAVLLGPTGGFLWGYALGLLAALAFLRIAGYERNNRPLYADAIAAVIFLALAYLCGWLQLMPTAGLAPEAAFAAGVAPFVLIDIAKIAIAVPTARAVRTAIAAQR